MPALPLGSTLSSTLGATSPLFAALFGILLLGELMTWPVAVGTLAIVAGIALLARGGGSRTGWPLWALLLPIGATFIRSFGHAMTKYGMESLPSPLFAGMIGVTVSLGVALATQRSGRREVPAPWRFRTHYWFVFAGLANATGLLSLNFALRQGELITVVPVVAASPVITLLLSQFLFRNEAITRQKLLAVAIIMPAVLLIAVAG